MNICLYNGVEGWIISCGSIFEFDSSEDNSAFNFDVFISRSFIELSFREFKKCLAFQTAHRIGIRKENFEFIPTEIVSDCTNVLISFILFLPCCNSDSVCLKVSNSYFSSDSISAVRRFILSLE